MTDLAATFGGRIAFRPCTSCSLRIVQLPATRCEACRSSEPVQHPAGVGPGPRGSGTQESDHPAYQKPPNQRREKESDR